MTPLNSPHRAFSPARHANFRFPQTRAAVLWGGGVGWGAMTFAFLAHMLDATQLFLVHMLDAKLFLAHMFDAHNWSWHTCSMLRKWSLRTCSMLRNCINMVAP